MTKLSGFLISWAMPAVNWPSEASFSVCTRRSCAVRKSSSDLASSRVRCLLGFEQPHVLDGDHRLIGEGVDQLDLLVGERPRLLRIRTSTPDRGVLRGARGRRAVYGPRRPLITSVILYSGSAVTSAMWIGFALEHRRPTTEPVPRRDRVIGLNALNSGVKPYIATPR